MILHHWDTDGICSAAIYIKTHGSDELFTPKIGNFYLDEEDFEYLKNYENIVILDMSLHQVEKLCEFSRIWIYDHHKSEKIDCAEEHYNPYLWGKQYPSCTEVLMERFSYPPDYLVALGIIGDVGEKVRDMKEWSMIKKVMKEDNVSFEDLKKAVYLLDSSYKLNKRREVVENVHLAMQGLKNILEENSLIENLETIKKEVEEWLSKAEDRGKYMFLRMKTPHQLISTMAREIAWNKGRLAVVINEKEDRDEFYIRSPSSNFNAYPFIDIARKLGYKAGGKREVMGAILPKGEGLKFFKIIEDKL